MKKKIVTIQDIITDFNSSIMIGDKRSDELAAKKSKILFQYVSKNIEKQIDKFIRN